MVGHSARNSSFRLPMLLLPPQKRRDLHTLYAFCRAVDDAVDDAPDKHTALANLAFWEAQTAAICGKDPPSHPIALAMRDLHRRVGFNPQDLLDLLQAMRMDAEEKMLYPSAEALDVYCYGAASCPGLLAMRVFGCEGEEARAFAIRLGKAMQLTNILRDLRVDARKGRIYLPCEDAGSDFPTPDALPHSLHLLRDACHHLARQAQAHYAMADTHAARLPKRAIAPALAMRDVYRLYFRQLQAVGWEAPENGKIALGNTQKTMLLISALGYLAG